MAATILELLLALVEKMCVIVVIAYLITRIGRLNTAVSVPYQPGQEGFPSVTYEPDS